jgi:hypothetical protein
MLSVVGKPPDSGWPRAYQPDARKFSKRRMFQACVFASRRFPLCFRSFEAVSIPWKYRPKTCDVKIVSDTTVQIDVCSASGQCARFRIKLTVEPPMTKVKKWLVAAIYHHPAWRQSIFTGCRDSHENGGQVRKYGIGESRVISAVQIEKLQL